MLLGIVAMIVLTNSLTMISEDNKIDTYFLLRGHLRISQINPKVPAPQSGTVTGPGLELRPGNS